MKSSSLAFAAILGVAIGGGITVAGMYHGMSLVESRKPRRTVSVRGLAEREVDADLAMWPITFTETSNDLVNLFDKISSKKTTIASFLGDNGFNAKDISYSAPRIIDQQAKEYGENQNVPKFRYMGKATVTVSSGDVPRVKKTIELSGTLVGKGIVIVAEDYDNKTQYFFKGLNSIKPSMIEEATKNARSVAEKFAADSGSKLGKILSASQGLFEITDRDQGTPEKKQVRVVTSVEYSLAEE
jgi:hypothetical protein